MSECEICEQKSGHHVLCPNYASAFIEEQNSELAALRTKLEEVRGILAGPDAGSLPNDYPLERMAANRMEERNKFMWQVRDTCTRAEEAERNAQEREARLIAENAELEVQLQVMGDGLRLAMTPIAHVTLSGDAEHYKAKWEEAERKLAEARAEGMEEAAKVCEVVAHKWRGANTQAMECIEAIRSAIEKEPSSGLLSAELDKANTGLAEEVRVLRHRLEDLVEAFDGSADMDEMDGPEYAEASAKLEAAIEAARPHTEKALIEAAMRGTE